mmetsp:Transcript_84613/g.137153  ORF Transcript_84613/g.137153 Transcript_84613/m.137153 type:complete len:332 (-) Transcript_84613:300-1295(-)
MSIFLSMRYCLRNVFALCRNSEAGSSSLKNHPFTTISSHLFLLSSCALRCRAMILVVKKMLAAYCLPQAYPLNSAPAPPGSPNLSQSSEEIGSKRHSLKVAIMDSWLSVSLLHVWRHLSRKDFSHREGPSHLFAANSIHKSMHNVQLLLPPPPKATSYVSHSVLTSSKLTDARKSSIKPCMCCGKSLHSPVFRVAINSIFSARGDSINALSAFESMSSSWMRSACTLPTGERSLATHMWIISRSNFLSCIISQSHSEWFSKVALTCGKCSRDQWVIRSSSHRRSAISTNPLSLKNLTTAVSTSMIGCLSAMSEYSPVLVSSWGEVAISLTG